MVIAEEFTVKVSAKAKNTEKNKTGAEEIYNVPDGYFINATVKTGPKKVVYISCNPATLVRDLQLFQEKGYEFKRIDPVDMFPQTPHVEAVTVLTKK